MKRSILILVLFVLFTGLFFSCKKNNNPTAQTCQLVALTDSTTSVQSTTQFTYDNSNRLSTIVVTGQNACKRTFQYIGSMLIFAITDTTPGISNEIDTVVLNSAGLIQTQRTYYPGSGSAEMETFFYDSSSQAATSSVEADNNGPYPDTMEYATVNGDLIYEKIKGQTVNKNEFTYYSSQNILDGDPTDFRQILYYGAYYYKNVHLLNVLYSPGVSYKAYTYTFNNNRIAQAKLRLWQAGNADTVTHIISYSYSCK